MIIPQISLSPQMALPLVGLGTWELRGQKCTSIVMLAYELGYRHFDTADLYENHEAIAAGLKGVSREGIWLTSKFLPEVVGRGGVEAICDRILKELRVDYLDLLLVHYPDRARAVDKMLEEMFVLKQKGKIREMGVSNFTWRHLHDLEHLQLPIVANQVEFHPYLYQKELLEYCQLRQIKLISYRSLGKGSLTQDETVTNIARKRGKSAAQVLLRWCVEKQIAVIPKASTKEHLKENIEIFDFTLDPAERELLDHLTTQKRFCNRGEWSDFGYV